MKTIIIKQGCLGRYDDVSPFLGESGTLALHFVLPRVSGEFYFVVWHSYDGGQNQRTIKIPETGDIELSGLHAGEIDGKVEHYFRGELIDTFPIEPLIIKNVEGSVRAFPEIKALEARAEAVQKTIEERDEKAGKTIEDVYNAIQKLRVAFVAYAWAEYQSDIQLNGKSLSFEKFVIALGYDPEQFSEEEIKKIKAFKEEL